MNFYFLPVIHFYLVTYLLVSCIIIILYYFIIFYYISPTHKSLFFVFTGSLYIFCTFCPLFLSLKYTTRLFYIQSLPRFKSQTVCNDGNQQKLFVIWSFPIYFMKLVPSGTFLISLRIYWQHFVNIGNNKTSKQ